MPTVTVSIADAKPVVEAMQAATDEIERLRGLLYECWPCVWDAVCSNNPHRRPLLEKMDEFMRRPETASQGEH